MISSKKSLVSNTIRLQHVIGISGTKNVGKSTSVLAIAEQLLCYGVSSNVQQNIHNAFAQWLTPKGNVKDIRLIVKYCGAYLYIASRGDDHKAIQDNIDFFRGNAVLKNVDIYEYSYSKGNFSKISNKNYLQTYPPHICISACRTNGTTMYPLDAFANISMFNKCIYVRKKDINDVVVNTIITMIDKLL